MEKERRYQVKINGGVNLLQAAKAPTNESSANKHDESCTHTKPNNCGDQIHIHHSNTPLVLILILDQRKTDNLIPQLFSQSQLLGKKLKYQPTTRQASYQR